jgi:hypothetical protein
MSPRGRAVDRVGGLAGFSLNARAQIYTVSTIGRFEIDSVAL